MRSLNHSLAIDIRLLPFDLAVNRVWSHELHRIGVLTADELRAIEKALDGIEKMARDEGRPLAVLAGTRDATADEDVHSLVERLVTEAAGSAGGKIHTGRSRNDQVATDLRLYLKSVLPQLQQEIVALMRAYVDQAQHHVDTVLPGYTHLQQAQPISLAHYLLSFVCVLQDDWTRFADALVRLDACPLGSGALAGSAYPIDRNAVASALGFSRATANSIAATAYRDECLEVSAACAICMTHLSRAAEDGILWSGQEFGFVRFADRVTTGSSMMPQKKNPDALELIRGKCARVLGQHHTLLTLMKGLPTAYARDLQEDKPALFDCLDQTSLSLHVMTEVIATAEFQPARMRAALDPQLFATELADYLVEHHVPFRRAHAIVATLVRTCCDAGTRLDQLTAQQLTTAAPEFAADALHCFDPTRALSRRNLLGGTGPESVRAQLAACHEWLKNPLQ